MRRWGNFRHITDFAEGEGIPITYKDIYHADVLIDELSDGEFTFYVNEVNAQTGALTAVGSLATDGVGGLVKTVVDGKLVVSGELSTTTFSMTSGKTYKCELYFQDSDPEKEPARLDWYYLILDKNAS